MKKRSLIFGVAAFVCAASIFSGCESPTDGSSGAAGAAGPIYLTGPYSSEVIQYALDSDAPVVFAGVEQSDGGTLIVPAGKGVTLIGDKAYSVAASQSVTIVLVDEASIDASSTGKIAKGSGASLIVIAPEDLKTKTASDVPEASFIAIQSGEAIEPAATFAVSGDITISDDDTSATNIKASDLSSTTALYVIGDLTVSNAIGSAITVAVLGDAAANAAETAAVNWLVKGKLTVTKAPTTGAGTIWAETLDVTGAGAAITLSESGTVVADELVTVATVTITTGTGGLTAGTVTGAAVFAADANITGAAFADTVKFAGAGTLSGEVSFAGDVTVTDAAALELASGKAVTLANGTSVKVGDSVLLTAGGETVLTPGGATTLTPASTGKKLTIGGADITLTSGVLTVVEGAELALAKTLTVDKTLSNAGTITIGADGALWLTGAAGTNGAKLFGEGTLVAAKTEITGAWLAVGEGGSVSITADSAGTGSTIVGSESVLTAGEGGVITQKSGEKNKLTIAENTTIALGGDATTPVGSIILTGDATPANGGRIELAGTKAVISGSLAAAGSTTAVDAGTVAIANVVVGGSISGNAITSGNTLSSLAGSLSTDDDSSALVGTISAAGTAATINAATAISD
jgi:hypothetical protein